MRKLILVGVSLVLLAACRPAEGEAGAFGVVIKNVGSDTIVNLAVEWAERGFWGDRGLQIKLSFEATGRRAILSTGDRGHLHLLGEGER